MWLIITMKITLFFIVFINKKISILIVFDKETKQCGFKATGVQPGDEKLINDLLNQFNSISQSSGFKEQLIKQAVTKSVYRSNNLDAAPIWRKESNKFVRP